MCSHFHAKSKNLSDVEGVDADRMNDHLQRAVEKLMGKGAENKSSQDAIK